MPYLFLVAVFWSPCAPWPWRCLVLDDLDKPTERYAQPHTTPFPLCHRMAPKAASNDSIMSGIQVPSIRLSCRSLGIFVDLSLVLVLLSLVSCFLFLVSCFLFLVSCFLFLVSCILVSCLVSLSTLHSCFAVDLSWSYLTSFVTHI